MSALHQSASIIVPAPVDRVYSMWTRFPDYPAFMSHVRSVTYIDRERTRWIVNVVGRHEWAARNENWIPGRQIGWRSLDGLGNGGLVAFAPRPDGSTALDITIRYTPPEWLLGNVREIQLFSDLQRFAQLFERRSTTTAPSLADARAARAPQA